MRALLMASLLAAGCASRKPAAADGALLALLPFGNHSLDLTAPGRVRAALADALERDGWRLLPLEETDAKLKPLGVSEGGHLAAFPPGELVRALGADLLAYGELLDYSFSSVGVLTRRRVEIGLRVVDPRTGETLWEGVEFGANSQAGVEAAANLGLGLAGKAASAMKDGVLRVLPDGTPGKGALSGASQAADEITGHDLRQEIRDAVSKLARRLAREKANAK